MTSFPKWNDVRADIVATSGGEEAVAEARRRNQAYIDDCELAERRTQTLSAGDSLNGGATA
ncbi:hypothetical protein [Nonomuraea bangladeshensis]|uniref:hypothetical protein n=1 Tax=Nonomuraea bangladeshensis TaxID=404385 RepID=UPI003C2C33D5